MTTVVNDALMRLTRRAEQNDPDSLVQTFVAFGPLLALLTAKDHQVIFGRRGTGKTHALTYLAALKQGTVAELAMLIDLRSVGSSGGIYSDTSLPLAERGTRLLVDTLSSIHDRLVDYALEGSYSAPTSGAALGLLDQLADQVSRVHVVGPVERERKSETETTGKFTAGISIGTEDISAKVGTESGDRDLRSLTFRESGLQRHSVQFGAVQQLLSKILDALSLNRLWILLDEWVSAIPLNLQPLLADLLRRCLLPIPKLTVKIAAIEHRSNFKEVLPEGDYLGIELGADMSADFDLDDFMVFGNDKERARAFFSELLAKHTNAEISSGHRPFNSTTFVSEAFTQINAFIELVLAAEGVPRDAINIAMMAAQRADADRISVPHIRTAAKTWYQRDKEAAANANKDARDLLIWIIDEVIGERRAKAFMLKQGDDTQHPLITALYDQRVLHLVRRGVSSNDQPGVRFNVYAIDYGCYVDLISTQKAPRVFLPGDTGGDDELDFEVPSEDYRSIRRAILDLQKFDLRERR